MEVAPSDADLARVSELVDARLGLHLPPARWADLVRGLAAAAPEFDLPDAATCAQRLLSAPLSDADVERLARHLTVGETYFFRDRALFDLIEQRLLPQLLRQHGDGAPRLRIWSAGCATGEEPYSIAMLLDRLLPQAGPGEVSLLGTDINPASLQKAVRGEYGPWSFRDTPAWVLERCFEPLPGKRFRLNERIRRRVTWAILNLADEGYPSLASNTHAMDLILCRNVLMYFSPAQAAAVVERLHRALRPGGWLVVTPAEMSSSLFARFSTVSLEGVTLYRKDPMPSLTDWPPNVPMLPAAGRRGAQPRPPVAGTALPPASVPAIAADPEPLLRAARDGANQGRFDAALSCCRRAIEADKLNPVAHHLLAAILLEQGQAEAAAQSFARALYLDPDFVLAHVGLAGLRRAQGRVADAVRHFQRALSLLRACAEDEAVPEAEGQHAGRLAEAIDLALAHLERVAEPAPVVRRTVHAP